jgi:hypothetical protein
MNVKKGRAPMYRRVAALTLAPALIPCLVALLPAEDAVEMKVKWNVGKCYVQSLTMSQEQTMSVPFLADAVTQKSSEVHEIATSVTKGFEDGSRELWMVFRSVKKKADTPRGTMSIDSTKDGASAIDVVMRKILGSKIRYLIGPDGEIKEAQRFAKTDSPTPGEKPSGKKLYSEEDLKGMCAQSLVEGLPAEPVKPGDTWTTRSELPVAGLVTLKIEMTHTFKGYEDLDKHTCAVIEGTGAVTGETGKDNPMGMKISVKEGGATSKVWFDTGLGMARKSTVNHTFKLEMTMQPPGAMQAMTNTIDQIQRTSVVLTRVGDIEKENEGKE